MSPELRPNGVPTGHVFRVERVRGPVWYMKYRLPDGRQVQKKLGPAWTARGRPPAGWFTRRTAEAALREVLEEARRGTLPGMVRTGATFADAAAEWLRFIEEDRERKPSTLKDYRSALAVHLLPGFGSMPLDDITPESIERWRRGLTGLSNRSKNKLLIQMHGIFRRAQIVWGLSANPLARVEKHPLRPSGDIQVFSPEEVWALVRAAASEQDGSLFLTAAFTGLRMGELLALRWRDVDFAGSTVRVWASYAAGQLTTPKSGKVRSVPMAPDVASALAQLGRREHWVGEDDLVFAGETGGYLDGSALRRRFKAALASAGLRSLRFHDLRHTFGTRMIAKADIRRVQEWMGHADIQTTMRYLHYAPHAEDAALVAQASRSLRRRTSLDIWTSRRGHLRTSADILTSDRDAAHAPATGCQRRWSLGPVSGFTSAICPQTAMDIFGHLRPPAPVRRVYAWAVDVWGQQDRTIDAGPRCRTALEERRSREGRQALPKAAPKGRP